MIETPSPSPSSSSEFDKYDEPRLHMERIRRAKLIEFNLPTRLVFILDRAGIRTLGDLLDRRTRLREVPQCGAKGQKIIEDFLTYMYL